MASRENGQTGNPHSIHDLMSVLKYPIPLIKYPFRVIRDACHHMYIVSHLGPMEGYIVATKHLWIKELTHVQYFFLITHILLYMISANNDKYHKIRPKNLPQNLR